MSLAKLDETAPGADICVIGQIQFVEMAYWLNVNPVDVDAIMATYLPLMIACVNDNGGSLAEDATMNEAMDADQVLLEEGAGAFELCAITTGLADHL